MKKLIVVFLSLLAFASCDNKGEQVDLLFKEVMGVHDEVMPEMSYLRKMAKTLEQRVDSVAKDSLTVSKPAVMEMKSAAGELRDANKQMMDWMYDFKQLEPDTPPEDALEYLNEQKLLITKVRDTMLEAKKKAETLLKQ